MSNLSDRARGAMPAARRFVHDAIERTAATFVFTFLAVWASPVLAGGVSADKTWDYMTDPSILQKGYVAAVAAVLTLLKAMVAKQMGNRDSASLDPEV
jgi:uncharacterized PurR-regulated membrane protein YhhQ (DUF165 family)